MSSPCCTDNLNEFNLTSLENPSLSNQGNVNLFYKWHNTERKQQWITEKSYNFKPKLLQLKKPSKKRYFNAIIYEQKPYITVQQESLAN